MWGSKLTKCMILVSVITSALFFVNVRWGVCRLVIGYISPKYSFKLHQATFWFSNVHGPDAIAELLKQADTREADKHAKKQRQAEKKQEEERKIVKNADHLKVVEQSWRGGNKSLGKPLTKYVRRWMSTGMINHLVNKRSCVQFIHQKCWEIPTTFELTQMSAHMFQQKTGIVPPECRDVAWEIKKFAMINYNFHQMLKYFIHFELALKIP